MLFGALRALSSILWIVLLALLAGCGRLPSGDGGAQTGTGPVESAGEEASTPVAIPPPDQVLRVAFVGEPITLDPARAGDEVSALVINQLFEGLLRKGVKGLEPGVAKSWDVSEDKRIYTFHLRDSRWSNGEPVTAADFELAWKRALDSAVGSPYAYQFYVIKGAREYHAAATTNPARRLALRDAIGVTAVDEKTLRVELEKPVPYFLDLTTFFPFYPVNTAIVKSSPIYWADDVLAVVSNGPFRLMDWKKQHEIRMLKNIHYWDAGGVTLKEVRLTLVPDRQSSIRLYEDRDADLARTGLAGIKGDGGKPLPGKTMVQGLMGTEYLVFNTAHGPLGDRRVRRALALAIDRKALANTLKGGEKPAGGVVPFGMVNPSSGKDFREESGELFPYDVDAARALLAEAGFPGGARFPRLTLLSNIEGNHAPVMQLISEMWKNNLGIEVELASSEWEAFSEALRAGRFQVARSGWIADYPDPLAMLGLFTSNGDENRSRWRHKGFDSLINEAVQAKDNDERLKALHEAEKVLMEEMPVVPLHFYSRVWWRREYVQGLLLDHQGDLILRNVRLIPHE